MTPAAALAGWLVAVNAVTFAAYWRDKRAARRGGRRTRERTLFTLNLAGGFVGGWLAMQVLRHKSRHASGARPSGARDPSPILRSSCLAS